MMYKVYRVFLKKNCTKFCHAINFELNFRIALFASKCTAETAVNRLSS